MSALLVLPLAMAGCPGGDDSNETAVGSSSGSTPMTSTDDSTGEPPATGDSSDSGPPPSGNCQEPREIPAAPVDCTGVDGILDGSAIIEDGGDDPSVLDGIRTVTGSIQINKTALTDLNFMACVAEVQGEVNIFGNDQLTNVDGLWSLTTVGTFIFSENGAVTEFNSLPNVQVIGNDSGVIGSDGNLIMKNNDSLQTINGFHSLVGVNNNITIQQNPVLTSIDGFGGLRVVGNVLAITNNPMLCISSVDCVGEGIVMPATPPDSWSTQANDNGC